MNETTTAAGVLCIEKDTAACYNCQHFFQHYVEHPAWPGGYMATIRGHCTYPRVKERRIDDVCVYFERRGAQP